MKGETFTRRDVAVGGGLLVAATCAAPRALAQTSFSLPPEVDLTDEPTRGDYGRYDVDHFESGALRNVNKEFVFPDDVEVDLAYGIDVSHHTEEVPWTDLRASKVNYVYVKASQSRNGRDGKFVEYWQAAADAGLDRGAYHFLTAGVPGVEQAAYFLRRLSEVGGLQHGLLQPVIDLEWDTYGPGFHRALMNDSTTYKDYWDDLSPAAIVSTITDTVAAIRAGAAGLDVTPIIYTNLNWWNTHIPTRTVFANTTVWISDFRTASYQSSQPHTVPGHPNYLWQFTDKASVKVKDQSYGPYDSNRLIFGGIDKVRIA